MMTRDERAAAIEAAAREVVETETARRVDPTVIGRWLCDTDSALAKLHAALDAEVAPEPQPALRYRLVDFDELKALGLDDAGPDPDFQRFVVLERADGSAGFVGADGGEPEDQTLRRDWKWVVPALNAALATGAASSQARIAELEAEVARLKSLSLCGVCMGFPNDHPSGLPCICGGSGLAKDEGQHARERNFDLERSRARLLKALEPFRREAEGLDPGDGWAAHHHINEEGPLCVGDLWAARDAYDAEKDK